MLAFLPHRIRGALVILLIICSTVIQFPFLMVASLLKLAIPWRPSRKLFTEIVTAIAFNWININCWLLSQATARQNWVVEGADTLRQDQWYLITCNHQSWADILIVQDILRKRAPFLKFFLKQELIWVPVIGVAWWALDFPFMKRYTQAQIKKNPELKGKDLETTRKACEIFRFTPVSVFNFMEGTRLTPEKHRHQNSPYKHLLKPKAGGTAFVLGAMGNDLKTLVNITIYYPYTNPGFWQLLCGQIETVYIHIEEIRIPDEFLNRDYMSDDGFREAFQLWVGDLWQKKDDLLESLQQQHGKKTLR
ncbi:MAG: acyltransferase [Hahellaceae bacterium]|nr:acyltransferase [Hahellaceae bacterium]